MDKNRILGIIPARYASTRFPGKPLAMIAGTMMIERVWQRVSSVLPHVVVATDDSRIADAVKSFGGVAVMTATSHKSGTDRCFEALEKTPGDFDVVINVQGDEPFIEPQQIEALAACFDSLDTDIATLVLPFDKAGSYEALANPNRPKVVVDNDMNAVYFSRSVIPYLRGVDTSIWASRHQYYTHVGMYAYRADVLAKIVKMQQSSLEIAESLEQLRWIQNGLNIKVAVTNAQSIGIDTAEDLVAAEAYLREKEK